MLKWNSTSVRTRMLVSVSSNACRSLFSFLSGLLVARGLSPAGYGDLTFLLGSFVAIRSLMDMGSSSAFFTFISREPGNRRHLVIYCCWLAMQFGGTTLMVWAVMPNSLLEKVWLGHDRHVILLAFVASFLQQQVWPTVSQLGESSRKTLQVQGMNLALAVLHLLVICLFLVSGMMTVKNVFLVLIIEYLAVCLVGIRLFLSKKMHTEGDAGRICLKETILEYWKYCRPLVLLAAVAFLCEFSDRWMLQRFGGGSQQGYYQIAYQFSAISLLATTSILNVFWKEVAEAHARKDDSRVTILYRKVSRLLIMCGAIMTGALIPWTEQIVRVFLGASYGLAAPVLALMFFYPIHQSMGQIGGTMLLACGRTKIYTTLSALIMLISLPVTYLIQAPPTAAILGGLGLGAKGMAIKMVFLNILSVNLQAWVIARNFRWRFDWYHQFIVIGSVVGMGFLSKMVVQLFWDLSKADQISLLPPVLLSSVIYGLAIVAVIWAMPWIVCMDRVEIIRIFGRLFGLKRAE